MRHVFIHYYDGEWDESQVHRGGNPANRGQFSKGSSSGSEPPKAEPSTRASAPSEEGEKRLRENLEGFKKRVAERKGGMAVAHTELETLFDNYRQKRMQAAQKTDPSAEDYPEQIDRMNEELGPVTRAVQQKMAETVGKAMGVDPKRVYFSDEHPTAKVGDRSFNVGGFAYHQTGRIEMFGVDRPGMNAAGTLAHEMMHVKYESIRQRRNAEYTKWIEASKNEDWSLPQEDRLMTGAGYMTDKAKAQYPLLADWDEMMNQRGQWQKLMEDDGITDYSREWWQAFHTNKANGDQATHETLAEMAKLDLEGSLDRLIWFKESTSWKPLYELVNKHYSASADDREHIATKQLAT